ncbi:E3 ubiquitin-protein ligase TRIM45-like [Amphiura filiformis]|uniref:E3 ubiquitin-protein ligase TRIM45-like n=1 Tax=Amphiura filiformis TaxID=82378 RepID=UPI003B20E260
MAEASSLIDKLDQKFLECGICLHRFRRPRGLPCLHSFCHECLETLCQGKKEVLCPNCKRATTVPDEGVSGFPAHFMVNSLQETVDMEKLKIKQDVLDSTICGNCKKPGSKVIVRCFDCNLLFCKSCHQSHDILEPMKAHQVVTVEALQSRKTLIPLSISKDQTCENHEGELKRFFCETCSKPVCRDCIVMKQYCRDHDYVSLKDASKKQATRLMILTKQCETLKKKCQVALQTTETVEKEFEKALKDGKQKLEEIKMDHRRQLEDAFQKYDGVIQSMEVNRVKALGHIKANIQQTIAKVDNACELSTNVTQMGSYYDITSIYRSLSRSLEELTQEVLPVAADEKLGKFDQVLAQPEFPQDCIKSKEGWIYKRPIRTEVLGKPQGITVDTDGYIVVTNGKKQAKIFSINEKRSINFDHKFDSNLYDVTYSPDIGYIFPGKNKICFFYGVDGNWKLNSSKPIKRTNNNNNTPKTLAVDRNSRIVLGLICSMISIHDQEGTFLSEFPIPGVPCYLGVTSKNEIAVTVDCNTLWLMDLSGGNKRKVPPPEGIQNWNPVGVCCSKQGEIFVVNTAPPKSIHRYNADGDKYLGCVVTGLDYPRGIAISEDGQHLFVAEVHQQIVEIFRRK